MDLNDIEQIAVLGAGSMGHGIGEVAALAGYDVSLRDVDTERVEAGIEEIEWSLGKLVEHGEIDEETRQRTRERITGVVDLDEAVGDADVVIEAIPERLELKRTVWTDVSEVAPERTLFATNTSSLSITEIAAATDRPGQFCGLHFFNPPVRMELVEVIGGAETTEHTLDVAQELVESFDKTPIRITTDSPGFVVNRVLVPALNEACWMVHNGETSIKTVDSTAIYELGLPMGIFELADHVGIDVCLDVLEYIHGELGDAYEPCPLIAEKVDAGALGDKAGRGFYEENVDPTYDREMASADVADRLLVMMANEVAKLLGESVATVETIDLAIELGLGFPDGPARLADERGIEGLFDTLQTRYDETDHPRYEPAPTLATHVDAGGFYEQPSPDQETSFEDLRIERPTTHVGAIVIDRPQRMNAISPTILAELPAAIDYLAEEDQVRVILLEGAGDRAFSAGADIQEMTAVWGDPLDAVDLSRRGQEAFAALEAANVPVIAAIQGYCLGGGMELATAADLRVAAEGATFSQPELDLGLLPGWGGTQRLPTLIGEGRAKEVILTADQYSAEEMADFGFVNKRFASENFTESAREFAAGIATGPPIAQRFVKESIHAGRRNIDAGLQVESMSFAHLSRTDDFSEGVSAFIEDRDPEFEGQ